MHGVTISVAFYIILCEITVQNKYNHLVPFMHIQTVLHFCLFICTVHFRPSVLLRLVVTNISVLQLNIKQEEVLIDMQQNSFNLLSDNSKILIIQYMRRVVPRMQVLLFTRKKASSIKQADLRNMFRKSSKNVCTSTVVVSPDPLSTTCQLLQLLRLQIIQKRTLLTLNQQIKGIHKQNALLIGHTGPCTGAGTKNYLLELRSLQVLSDNLKYLII